MRNILLEVQNYLTLQVLRDIISTEKSSFVRAEPASFPVAHFMHGTEQSSRVIGREAAKRTLDSVAACAIVGG